MSLIAPHSARGDSEGGSLLPRASLADEGSTGENGESSSSRGATDLSRGESPQGKSPARLLEPRKLSLATVEQGAYDDGHIQG